MGILIYFGISVDYTLLTFLPGMQKRMPRQVLLSEERLIADRTPHRLLALVYELDVGCQARPPVEGTIAMRAREGVLTSVVEDVRTKLRRLDESLATELADVRFLAGVSTDMAVQGFFRREPIVALFTFVWTFSSMHPPVFFHRSARWKSFRAHIAWIGTFSCVGSQMNGQQRRTLKLLAAKLADEHLLPLHLTGMTSEVFTQIILAGEYLVANLIEIIV